MGLIPTPNTGTQGLNQTDQNAVQTVADNIVDVSTVADALDAGTIDAVVADKTNIGTVSENIGNINSLALIDQELKTLAGDLSNIDLVAANIAEIGNVSINMATLLLLHTRMADLLGIASSLPNIDAVAANEANVNSVAINIPDITNVVSHMEDIHYVAQNSTAIETLYASIDGIIAIAANPDALTTVADNIDVIIDASTYVSDINENLVKIEAIEANVIALEASATTSASNASTSETNASASASASATSAIDADTHADRAEAAKSAAVISETNAATSESNAATSASNAASSASSASASESLVTAAAADAISAKNDAIDARNAAQTSETNAGLSETNAAASASAASTSETNAATSETNAGTQATNAQNSALAAAGHASDAEGFKNTAQGQATDAANSASAAATSESNALTSANNSATSASNASTSAGNAATSESNASTSESNAFTYANNASVSASAAQTAETNAETAEANAVIAKNASEAAQAGAELAESNAAISETNAAQSASEAADDAIIARSDSERDFYARRKQYDVVMAASGFVHFGKHHASLESINEGLYSFPNASAANQLFTGRSLTNTAGLSKTDFPIVNIAGVVTEFTGVNTPDWQYESRIKFPDAPDGTVTYDSVTGAITDFTTDVDPKYGDVAGDLNEAVARAFEGDVKNGDLRNGTTDWTANITDIYQDIPVSAGQSYTVTGSAVSGFVSFYNGQSFAGGDILKSFSQGESGTFVVTPTQNYIRVYIQEGLSTFTSSASLRSITNSVVTDRVDMFGLEGYLEEVTLLNPHVYPNGLIQSQATTMNGIPTARSNRPDSYYAVFTGDTTSAGLGVNYWAASDAEKAAMRADPDNNIYVGSDGKVYQFRIRQRTIAGAGNGDWGNINPNSTSGLNGVAYSGNSQVVAQGSLDSAPTYVGASGDNMYRKTNATLNDNPEAGLFTVINNASPSRAVNGECYWLPLGTVSRLNQGAYHQSFNPSGCRFFMLDSTGDNITDSVAYWYSVAGPHSVVNKRTCFNYLGLGVSGTIGADDRVDAGTITAGISGRPDGRFYDAIYADGQGGVQQDLRLSAQGGTISDILGTEDARTKNGTQRGLQKLVRTAIDTATSYGWGFGSNTFATLVTKKLSVDQGSLTGEKVAYLVNNGNIYEVVWLRIDGSNQYAYLHQKHGDVSGSLTGTSYIVFPEPLNTSVSGEFSQTDVIGDPAQILATSDLANGWLGNWIPVIPDGAIDVFPLHRKYVGSGSDVTRTYTTNNGSAWTSGSIAISDTISNETGFTNMPANQVTLYSYTAHAYMTEAANNPVVYKGAEGVGDVWASSIYATTLGSLFAESIIGKVLVASNDRPEGVKLDATITRDDTGVLDEGAGKHRHTPIDIVLPNNNSPAVKALTCVSEENGQLFLYYLSTELIWDTTLDDSFTFTEVAGTDTQNATPVGTWMHITSGVFSGVYRQELLASAISWDSLAEFGYYKDSEGIKSTTGLLVASQWSGNGWGDDNLITVLDGEGTKTDLNGNKVKVSCTKVPYPLGWVKNNV